LVVLSGWLSRRLPQRKSRRGRQTSFVERTIATLRAASEYSEAADEMSRAGGVLQRVDPRVKIVGLLGMVVVVAASHRLPVIGGVFAVALSLALASRVEVGRLARLVWIPVAFFTGAVALPAVFLTPGRALFVVGGIQITAQGLRSAAFLVSRAETAATLSALLVLTTPWPWVLKALRILKCPMVLVAILGMTYRYIFVILQTAFDMFESRKSRTVGILEPRERRRLAASAVGVLMSKSFQLSGDVHLAMRSRGFRGEVYVLQEFRARAADWCWLAAFVFSAMASLWLGL
jgi:cobalt/nickel transport system permease protein